MNIPKEPWTDDLNQFLGYLNPKNKSYDDVVKAVSQAWRICFDRYATMLIYKDVSDNQDLLKAVEKKLDWEEDFNQWLSLKTLQYVDEPEHVTPSLRETWEEAYNTYVKYGQTQAAMDDFVQRNKELEGNK